MAGIRVISALGVGLAIAGAPLAMSAPIVAAPLAPALAATSHAAPIYSGRSMSKMKRKRGAGSYANEKPDGANTGSRKQTPTGGNPGNGDHS